MVSSDLETLALSGTMSVSTSDLKCSTASHWKVKVDANKTKAPPGCLVRENRSGVQGTPVQESVRVGDSVDTFTVKSWHTEHTPIASTTPSRFIKSVYLFRARGLA